MQDEPVEVKRGGGVMTFEPTRVNSREANVFDFVQQKQAW